jgi:siroheme synthase-like protein
VRAKGQAIMVPILLDITKVKIAVAGEGAEALGRIRFLKTHGATPAAVFAPKPSDLLRAEAGAALVPAWPRVKDLQAVHVLFAAGLAAEVAEAVAEAARQAKTLLNLEDRTALCDAHVPATVRRGDLLLTASTGGRAPGLAKRLALWLANAFGPEWEGRLGEIAEARGRFRAAGLKGPALAARTDRLLAEKGWLQ